MEQGAQVDKWPALLNFSYRDINLSRGSFSSSISPRLSTLTNIPYHPPYISAYISVFLFRISFPFLLSFACTYDAMKNREYHMSTSEGKEYKARQMDPQIKSILKGKDRANNSYFFSCNLIPVFYYRKHFPNVIHRVYISGYVSGG